MSLKLASDNNYIKTANDYRDLYPGFTIPEEDNTFLNISKYADEKRSLVKKLAAIEKHIDGVMKSTPANSKDKYLKEQRSKLSEADGISDHAIEELRKFEPSKLLKALADHGIVFSPEDFVKYLFGAKALGSKSEDMFSKIKKRLPSMFSDMDESGDDEMNDDKYEPSVSDIMPKGLLNMVKGLFDDHSLFDKPSHNRIMRITIVKKSPKARLALKEENTKEAAVDELSRQYSIYKLAALRYMNSQNRLDEDTIFNALMQNR
jgi:hypothetical protein